MAEKETNAAARTELRTIISMFRRSRGLSNFYLEKIPHDKFHVRPEASGVVLNSAYWLTGHLIWAERGLVIKSTGGTPVDLPWIKDFAIGADPEQATTALEVPELLATMTQSHEQAIAHIKTLSEAQLDKEGAGGMFKTWRDCLYHAIRHEASHAGHLGWLCKIHGVKTF